MKASNRSTRNTTTHKTALKTALNKAYSSIRYHATNTYMTKKELVTVLVEKGFAMRTSYRFIENLENNNKIKTVSLYKIK